MVFFYWSSSTFAASGEINDMSLEDLLDIKVSVVTKKDTSARRSPGIVTVLTEREIVNSGARDLIDLLRTVPGLNFGLDVQNVVGLGVRGLWAQEGKVLLLVDGVEFNEILYSSLQFGNHFPVEHIKRIEIIRGPGSVVYGGFAELAVIRVTTRGGQDLSGVQAVAKYGNSHGTTMRKTLSLAYGQKHEDWDVSLAIYLGEGKRGNGEYVGYQAADPGPGYEHESYRYENGNDLNPRWFNLGVSNGKLDLRVIRDEYRTESRAMLGYTGLSEAETIRTDFDSTLTALSYRWDVSKKLEIKPFFAHKTQTPWRETQAQVIPISGVFDIRSERTRGGLDANYMLSDKTSVLLGTQSYLDRAEIRRYTDDTGADQTFANGTRKVNYTNRALYAQIQNSMAWWDTTLGVRYDDHSQAGDSVVPRLGLTHSTENWHWKALVAQAFRQPGVLNIETNSKIKPETTTTTEVEFGHRILSSYLTVNLFDTKIKDPIVYSSDGAFESYANFDETGSRGVEVDWRFRKDLWEGGLTYATYEKTRNTISTYEVRDDKKSYLGMPREKIALSFQTQAPNRKWSLSSALIYTSKKWTNQYNFDRREEEQVALPVNVLGNVFATYRPLQDPGFELGLGVFNAFNNDARFVQPYGNSHGHIPGPKREVVARVSYHLGF